MACAFFELLPLGGDLRHALNLCMSGRCLRACSETRISYRRVSELEAANVGFASGRRRKVYMMRFRSRSDYAKFCSVRSQLILTWAC